MTKNLELQFKDFAAGCMDKVWQGQLDLIKDLTLKNLEKQQTLYHQSLKASIENLLKN